MFSLFPHRTQQSRAAFDSFQSCFHPFTSQNSLEQLTVFDVLLRWLDSSHLFLTALLFQIILLCRWITTNLRRRILINVIEIYCIAIGLLSRQRGFANRKFGVVATHTSVLLLGTFVLFGAL